MTRVPVGKVVALAAMPTAVLMGMGLTPQLAQAKPGVPENPFQDGPCVTAPDEQSKDAEKDAAEKAAADKAAAEKAAADKAKKEAERKKQAEDARKRAEDAKKKEEADKPTSPPSAETPDKPDEPESGADKPESGADRTGEAGTKAPEPSKPTNPLDPLGVGDALKDLLTPGEREKESPAPKPSESKDPEDIKGGGSRDGKATEPVEGAADKAKDTADDIRDKAEDEADKAKDEADKAKDKIDDKAEDKADGGQEEPDPEESEDPMAPDENGKKPFPCVVEKKVDGDDEQSPAPIPNQPWHLEASSLLLKGADYKGVVNLKMPNGQTKQALKYIISGGTDIGDLHQIVDGPGGKKYHVQAAKGSTSTIRKGDTTMYTERISGNLFGLIPVTFDPEHPPPLNLPLIYFTNVKVQQAGQFGGELTIPGLHQSITD
ncbi:hypothetical protein [Streptomyces sp. NRRL B-1347]|uniref:hypothetical protein n=1 Tax=Streptomyces sp. NRRL B-1347 TaxID=1476877 RepID=UPI001F20D340|nr:hypothetical protein [Streptomyces sp. NRRL B-1347]